MTYAPPPPAPPSAPPFGGPPPRPAGGRIAQAWTAAIGAVALAAVVAVAVTHDDDAAAGLGRGPGGGPAGQYAPDGSGGQASTNGGSDSGSDSGSGGGTGARPKVANPVRTGQQLRARFPLPPGARVATREEGVGGTGSQVIVWSAPGTLASLGGFYKNRMPSIGLAFDPIKGGPSGTGRITELFDTLSTEPTDDMPTVESLGSLQLSSEGSFYVEGKLPRGRIAIELQINDVTR